MGREDSADVVVEFEQPLRPKSRFDSNGVRKAVIGLLQSIHRNGRHGTIAELLIALEVIDSHIEGQPHSMKSLAEKLDIPYTSVSRIVYSLTSDATPDGILKLVPDKKDRRRKHIDVNFDVSSQTAAHVRVLERVMVDYYGGSVQALRKAT
jgi:hypothetical protein